MTRTFERGTGRAGVLFWVGSIRWETDTIATMYGGLHKHGLWATGVIFRLEYRGGKWAVLEEKTLWLS